MVEPTTVVHEGASSVVAHNVQPYGTQLGVPNLSTLHHFGTDTKMMEMEGGNDGNNDYQHR